MHQRCSGCRRYISGGPPLSWGRVYTLRGDQATPYGRVKQGRLEGRSGRQPQVGKGFLSRGANRYKGPGAGRNSVCLKQDERTGDLSLAEWSRAAVAKGRDERQITWAL